MLCKNCGKELPIAGKFCPFCGAPIEQVGVDDETAAFKPVPGETPGPIDPSAFDAARQDEQQAAQRAAAPQNDPFADDELPPIDVPPVRRAQGVTPPRTTYFEQPDPTDRPYKKPSSAKKGLLIFLAVFVVLALIGGGIWFALSHKPDENLTDADKYMARGKFDEALTAYQAALTDAKDPTGIQQKINLLTDYQTAAGYVENGEYAQALALLSSLKDRASGEDSTLTDAIDTLVNKATQGQSDSAFSGDLQQATEYLNDKKFDQCAAILDTLNEDDSLTDDQKKQTAKLRSQLDEAKKSAQEQEQTQKQNTEQKQNFIKQMDDLEASDEKISSADTNEKALEATSTSFEAWDTLLSDMYSFLETTLNADQYASEETSYKEWVKARDEGAENAAKDSSDDISKQLAKASFKQSYTKTRCYKLLDLM